MQVHNGVEEHACHRVRRVRVTQWNEVTVLEEPIDNGEDHRLDADFEEAFDEVHDDVAPDLARDLSRAGEEGRLEGTGRRRLYLNEVVGLGPGPRRRGGAVIGTAPMAKA